MAVVDVFLGVVKAVVFIYDIVTFPVYQVGDTTTPETILLAQLELLHFQVIQRPWETKFKDKQPLGKVSISAMEPIDPNPKSSMFRFE